MHFLSHISRASNTKGHFVKTETNVLIETTLGDSILTRDFKHLHD